MARKPGNAIGNFRRATVRSAPGVKKSPTFKPQTKRKGSK